MSLNKKILEKITDKASNDAKLKDCFIEILQYENRGKGWFKEEYVDIIEKYTPGGDEKE